MINNMVDNIVIKNETREMGKKIIEYFRALGIRTGMYNGSCYEENGDSDIYYGVINGDFDNYTLEQVKQGGAKIIKLPEYPKVMRVAHDNYSAKSQRVVIGIVDMGHHVQYVAFRDAKTLDDIPYPTEFTLWNCAEDIPETEPILIGNKEVEITDDGIKVGCTQVDNETIKKIYNLKFKDNE